MGGEREEGMDGRDGGRIDEDGINGLKPLATLMEDML